MFKYLSSLFLAVALLFAAQAPAQTFAHYVGASGKPLASNGMQQVAEYNYNIYVTSKAAPNMEAYNGSNFLLFKLPLQNYLASNRNNFDTGGSDLEPQGYFRWYNYRTDLNDDAHLAPYDFWMTKAALRNINYASTAGTDKAGKSAGWFGWNLGNFGAPRVQNPFKTIGRGADLVRVGCWYKLTTDCDNADWEGSDIACDVSRYQDYNDLEAYTPGTFTHEPTLSIRYIFHVRSAYTLANALRDALIKENAENLTYEDHKITVFGVLNTSSFFTVRSDMSDATYYFFYPMSNSDTKHVYATD